MDKYSNAIYVNMAVERYIVEKRGQKNSYLIGNLVAYPEL